MKELVVVACIVFDLFDGEKIINAIITAILLCFFPRGPFDMYVHYIRVRVTFELLELYRQKLREFYSGRPKKKKTVG